MKKKNLGYYGKKAGSVMLAAMLTVSGLASAASFAVCAEEAETEVETEAETEAEAEVTEIELTVDGETVVVTNESGLYIESIAFEAVSAEDAEAESEAETAAAAEEEAAAALVVTEADGTVHTFEGAYVDGLSNLKLTSMIGYVFFIGTESGGDEKYFYETAEDVTLEEPVTMYTTGMVNIREEADGSSTLLGTAARGSELQVLGGTSKWFLVTQDDVTGYVAARYLTESTEEAQAAVDEEASARAALEAQAAAAAAAAAASSSSSGSDVVSKEAVYDCDGSGHGYYIITHSDGSVTYEDF
ncbi:MAG: SH3 domain-containing protein [Lachnospiraceae bacterium]|nr:SH3 domain-containing protein [Lachnospiraceae bacterium]MCD7841931.1 SH3 domain-containing protein [Lachnospiraceae bacterium]